MKQILILTFCVILSQKIVAQPIQSGADTTFSPWTYWWWPGSATDKKGITWQLENFKKSGLGGAHIIPIYGVKGEEKHFLPFLGKEWLDIFSYTCSEAKRLGLGIDLTTGTGWPFGGPGVTLQNAAKQIVFHEADASDTSKIAKSLRKSGFAETTVFRIDPDGKYQRINNFMNIGSQGVSAGTKYLIITYEPTNQKVKRAAPGGEGNVVDHFDSNAMKQYLSVFDSSLLKNNRTPRPRAMYNDSYEVYGANWTTGFFDTFKKQHQYDLQEVIYAVSPGYPDGSLKEKVTSDYRETLSSMLYDAAGTWTKWVTDHHMISRYQAHGSPGNLLDLYGLSDVPETESFGSSSFSIPLVRVDPDFEEKRFGRPHPLMMKFASSPAHLLGKKLVSSESTTWLGNHFKVALSQIKPQIDELFTAGINHIFFHGTTYSPPGEPFPGWLFYASTNYGMRSHFHNEFPLLNHYITNCQKLLQESEPDNDLLVYLPIYDFWANTKEPLLSLFTVHDALKWFRNVPFGELSQQLWEKGYGFDYISDLQINQLKVNSDNSVSINKSRYQTILIPKTVHMTVETLKNLAKFASQGARIIFDQNLPVALPGKGREAQQMEFDALKIKLSQSPNVITGAAEVALKQLNIRHETLPASGLSFIRKKSMNGNYWLITNLSDRFVYDSISLSGSAKSLEYYDPMSGDRGFVDFKKEGNSIRTKLYLPQGSSCFLMTSNQLPKGDKWQFRIPSDQSEVVSDWTVKFTKGTPKLPGTTFHPSELTSWTSWPDSSLQWYNGYGTYNATFKIPDQWKTNRGVYLQVDDLRETAQVTINGTDVGTIWAVPFQLYIPMNRLKFGQRNTIKMEVRNLSANEARYLDTKGIKWRKFYDANIVDITYQPFDASRWKPVESGILGKVKIVSVK